MRVRFSRPASGDLSTILADLVAKNASAAKRFESRIRQITALLGQYPNSFQELADRRGVRRVPLRRYPYLLFYKVIAGEVLIVRIAHGAREEPWDDP